FGTSPLSRRSGKTIMNPSSMGGPGARKTPRRGRATATPTTTVGTTQGLSRSHRRIPPGRPARPPPSAASPGPSSPAGVPSSPAAGGLTVPVPTARPSSPASVPGAGPASGGAAPSAGGPTGRHPANTRRRGSLNDRAGRSTSRYESPAATTLPATVTTSAVGSDPVNTGRPRTSR